VAGVVLEACSLKCSVLDAMSFGRSCGRRSAALLLFRSSTLFVVTAEARSISEEWTVDRQRGQTARSKCSRETLGDFGR
jgi:hypothetical protein